MTDNVSYLTVANDHDDAKVVHAVSAYGAETIVFVVSV